MRIKNKLCQFTKLERSVRQGCVFSVLFRLNSESILSKLETITEFDIGGRNLNSIIYSDMLMADSERELQALLEMVAK